MNKILITIAIGLSFAQNGLCQTTTEIYQDNFHDSTYDYQSLHLKTSRPGTGFETVSNQKNIFQGSPFLKLYASNPLEVLRNDLDEPELHYFGNLVKLVNYNTLEADFNMHIFNSRFYKPFTYNGISYTSSDRRYMPITYINPQNGNIYSQVIMIDIFLTIIPPQGSYSTYDTITGKMNLKWTKQNYPASVTDKYQNSLPLLKISIQRFVLMTGNYNPNSSQSAISGFCSTTDNYNDCMANLGGILQQGFGDTQVAIDNLVIKGNSFITGLGLEDSFTITPRRISKSVDMLGRTILNLDSYEGTAIILYDDGTKEKIVK